MLYDKRNKCKSCNLPIAHTIKYCSKKCRIEHWKILRQQSKRLIPNKQNKDTNTDVIYKRKELKSICINILGGCCNRCGYNKCHAALCFHHKDPSTKLYDIASLISYGRLNNILHIELNKCELLCSNCHLEHHSSI